MVFRQDDCLFYQVLVWLMMFYQGKIHLLMLLIILMVRWIILYSFVKRRERTHSYFISFFCVSVDPEKSLVDLDVTSSAEHRFGWLT
jgi:hypothetical protein